MESFVTYDKHVSVCPVLTLGQQRYDMTLDDVILHDMTVTVAVMVIYDDDSSDNDDDNK